MEIKEGSNIKKYLIEITPFKQTQKPVPSKDKNKSNLLYEQMMYQNVYDKRQYAEKFAKKQGMEYIIITEKELN